MRANAEIGQTSSKPILAHVEPLSMTLNADNEEIENGGQIDPFTACCVSLYGYLERLSPSHQ